MVLDVDRINVAQNSSRYTTYTLPIVNRRATRHKLETCFLTRFTRQRSGGDLLASTTDGGGKPKVTAASCSSEDSISASPPFSSSLARDCDGTRGWYVLCPRRRSHEVEIVCNVQTLARSALLVSAGLAAEPGHGDERPGTRVGCEEGIPPGEPRVLIASVVNL